MLLDSFFLKLEPKITRQKLSIFIENIECLFLICFELVIYNLYEGQDIYKKIYFANIFILGDFKLVGGRKLLIWYNHFSLLIFRNEECTKDSMSPLFSFYLFQRLHVLIDTKFLQTTLQLNVTLQIKNTFLLQIFFVVHNLYYRVKIYQLILILSMGSI